MQQHFVLKNGAKNEHPCVTNSKNRNVASETLLVARIGHVRRAQFACYTQASQRTPHTFTLAIACVGGMAYYAAATLARVGRSAHAFRLAGLRRLRAHAGALRTGLPFWSRFRGHVSVPILAKATRREM